MKQCPFTVFLWFMFGTALAYAPLYGSSLSGRVVDAESSRPIASATITISETGRSYVTDTAGGFAISNLTLGQYRLNGHAIGYADSRVDITVTADRPSTVTLRLSQAPIAVLGTSVVASRTSEKILDQPAMVTVLSDDEIIESASTTTADVLRHEVGITVQKTTQGHGSPILRGLIGNYVLLLYNGIRLNNSALRSGPNQYLNSTDGRAVDRIELLRGPGSVMYGSDAFAGVVQFINQPAFASAPGTHISGQATGYFHSASAGKSIQGRANVSGSRLALKLSGGADDVSDLRAGGTFGTQNPTGWSQHNWLASMRVGLSPQAHLQIDHFGVRQKDVPRFDKYLDSTYQTFIYNPQEHYLTAITFTAEPATGVARQWVANVSYQASKEGREEQRKGSSSRYDALDKVSTWGAYGLSVVSLSSRIKLISGGEFYHDYVRSSRIQYNDGTARILRPALPDSARYWSSGIFTQTRFELTPRLSLATGLRYNRFSTAADLEAPFGRQEMAFDQITGAASVIFRKSDRSKIYASLAHSFRAPNLDDLFTLNTTNAGMDAPNPELAPEEGYTVEVGTLLSNNAAYVSGAVYYSYLIDLLDRNPGLYNGLPYYDENGNDVRDEGEIPIYQKTNFAKGRIYGLELEGGIVFAKLYVVKQVGHGVL